MVPLSSETIAKPPLSSMLFARRSRYDSPGSAIQHVRTAVRRSVPQCVSTGVCLGVREYRSTSVPEHFRTRVGVGGARGGRGLYQHTRVGLRLGAVHPHYRCGFAGSSIPPHQYEHTYQDTLR
eukprot:2895581-Rhodomonas_salina.1